MNRKMTRAALPLLAVVPRLPSGPGGAGPVRGCRVTQRSMRTKGNEVTVELDLSGMADGQQAGTATS